MNSTGLRTRRKACARWSKNANQTGRTAENTRTFSNAHLHSRSRGIHSSFNLQAGEAGKAVQIGRGPATVIGRKAVSQATLPCRRGPRSSRERAPPKAPGCLVGLFWFELVVWFCPAAEIRSTGIALSG